MIFTRVVGSYLFSSKAVCSIFLCMLSISLSLGVNSTIIKPSENEIFETIENAFFSKNNSEKREKIIKKIKALDPEILLSGSSIKVIEGRDIYMSLYRQLQNGSDDKEHDFYHYTGENDLDYYIAKGNFTNNAYMLVKDPDYKDFKFMDKWHTPTIIAIIRGFKESKAPLRAIYAISHNWISFGGMCYDDITKKRWARNDTKPNDALANAIIERSVFR